MHFSRAFGGRWWHLFVWTLLLPISNGAITAPNSKTPIRLSSTSEEKVTTTQHRWNLQQNQPVSASSNRRLYINDLEENEVDNNPDAIVNIVEPPNESFLAGGNFYVAVQIVPENETAFRQKYLQNGDGRLCLSLDEAPYHCWPIDNAKIFFSQAIEGSHSIVAKLFKGGELQHTTKSKTTTFTIVYNPKLEVESGTQFYSQIQAEDEENEEDELVDVTFPVLRVVSPAEKVSYSGNSITFASILQPLDPNQFKTYFSKAFTCLKVDAATAHSCFPIFGAKLDPLVLDLETGMHTIEAVLSHPQTGDLLEGSSLGPRIFFIAGVSNEAALFTAEVNINGQIHVIPIVKGGSIFEQTKALCFNVGLHNDTACSNQVLEYLKSAAEQRGIISQNHM